MHRQRRNPLTLGSIGFLLALLALACSTMSAPAGPTPTHMTPAAKDPTPTVSTSVPGATPQPVRPGSPANTHGATPAVSLTPPPEPAVNPETSVSAGAAPAARQLPPPAEAFAPAPDRDLYQLAAELLLPPNHPPVSPVVNPEPVSYAAGRVDRFWLADLERLEIYQSDFELRLVTPHAYWYVEKGQVVADEDLERASQEFEEVIYPRVTSYFGQEWTPGVDNDPRLTLAHGRIRGAAGYFSSTDEYPKSVRPRSNQREMFYIDTHHLKVGSDFYRQVLAHELQHAIHWRHDRSENTWVSEGMAELAVTVAGYPAGSPNLFMEHPFVSLIHWPLDHANIAAHYGGASLFMHYLAQHYPAPQPGQRRGDLWQLQAQPKNGIPGVDAYLKEAGYTADFHAVFQDWTAANFLDADQGVYGYAPQSVAVRPSRTLNRAANLEREVAQYGTHYIELGPALRDQPLRLRFRGAAENRLLPAETGPEGCWWSNSGDSITSTLARSVDLRQASQATLTYEVWHSIEEDWDYVYLQVSRDGGARWEVLETPHTSYDDPLEVAFGPGYTGQTQDWVTERVDLSSYAGQEIIVRFQYVTDDSVNGIGLCLRRLALPQAGVVPGDGGWQANGFLRIDNRVRQGYFVQALQKGQENRVARLPLVMDGNGGLVGETTLEPYPGLEQTIVAVSAFAPAARSLAPYQLSVSAASR